jgi:hypothetical protein
VSLLVYHMSLMTPVMLSWFLQCKCIICH